MKFTPIKMNSIFLNMELQEKLLSSNNPSEILLEEGGSFYELIQNLHQSASLPDELMMPLIKIGQTCGFNFTKITQPLRDNLISTLGELIVNSPGKIPQILDELHPFLNCTPFHPLFEKIVLNIKTLPDYFLLDLLELPSEKFLSIFPTQQSKSIIFHKCKPIFHRLLFKALNEFAGDPSILDQFLVSIKMVIPKKPVNDDFSQEFNYYLNFQNLEKNNIPNLKNLHNQICKTSKDSLLDLCCKSDDLYQEICCILRDLWEKTGNPLYAALRIEICYDENITWRSDPIQQLSRWIFSFLSDDSIIDSVSPPYIDSKDAFFALNDLHFQFLLYCLFLKHLVLRVSEKNYITFNERSKSRNIVRILYPQVSDTQLEDFANYIEAYYVTIAIYDDPNSDESEAIRSYLSDIINNNDQFCDLMLFCGQQMIQRRKDQSFLDMVVQLIQKQKETESENKNDWFMNTPNMIIAHMMLSHLSYSGLVEIESGDSIDKRMNILYDWSKICHSIRTYFISLLAKRSYDVHDMANAFKDPSHQKDTEELPLYLKEFDVIKKWTNKIWDDYGKDGLDSIENAMLETTDNNLKEAVM